MAQRVIMVAGAFTFLFVYLRGDFPGSAFTRGNVHGYANEDGYQGGSCGRSKGHFSDHGQ